MSNIWITAARETAAQCWCDEDTKKIIMDPVLCESVAHRISHWMEAAAQSQRNTDYYKGLLVQCGESIGDSAYISEDGSTQQDVLCAKIPELVEALCNRNQKQEAIMDPQLAKTLTDLKSKYGEHDGIIQTSKPYHACIPSVPCAYEATAIRIDGDIATCGWLWWDFANLPDYDKRERERDLPFDTWENSFSGVSTVDLDNPGELRALLLSLRNV